METILAIPFGIAIGLVVATVGGGGAILALPVLVYALGEPVGPATTASLIVVALGASVGAGIRARRGQVCWPIVVPFCGAAVFGAYAGTVAGRSVSGAALVLAFVPVMLAAAVATYRWGGADEASGPEDRGCPPPRLLPAAACGLAVGIMTGFFGVGGGFLIVPALTFALKVPLERAIASSLAIITITGLAALTSHLLAGAEPNWPLTLMLCASAGLGAVLGTALGTRLHPRTLARAFGVVVAIVAVFLLLDVIAFGGPPT